MITPNSLRFEAANGLRETEIKNAEFLVYAHQCLAGIYIGMAHDPVLRWQQHVQDAMNEHSHNTDDKFREAIRAYRAEFKHYILAIAKFEQAARRKEAEAILYYKPELNTRNELGPADPQEAYRPLADQITSGVILGKRSRSGSSSAVRGDSERVSIVAEVYMHSGRKRLRCIKDQKFKEGLRVECSREERNRFNPGDKVKVKVALASKKGQDYLVAAKTARLQLVD